MVGEPAKQRRITMTKNKCNNKNKEPRIYLFTVGADGTGKYKGLLSIKLIAEEKEHDKFSSDYHYRDEVLQQHQYDLNSLLNSEYFEKYKDEGLSAPLSLPAGFLDGEDDSRLWRENIHSCTVEL